MGSFNKVILAGNITRDAEVRTLSTGKHVAKFGVAVNNVRNKEDVLFVDVTAWDKLGDFAGTYLKKGTAVLVEGRLAIRSYEKDGQTRKATEVVASSIQMLGGKKAAATPAAEEEIEADGIPF